MRNLKFKLIGLPVSIPILLATLTPIVSAAGVPNIYLKPTSMMVNGSTFTVQIRVNTNGNQADTVEADFTYPAGILTLNSISTAPAGPTQASPFNTNASTSFGGGSASIQRGTTLNSPPSAWFNGDGLLATLSFSVTSVGTADLVWQNTSQVFKGGVDLLASTTDLHAIGIPGPLQNVYRLANWITHERLFTTSAKERDNAVAKIPGWVYEGVAFYAPPSSATGSVPIYRLANWITHERQFTTSAAERDHAVAKIPGWVYEGVAFYAAP
jgi:hypothetical protein